jgi:cobalt/nickel transport system permease protein
MIGIPFHLALHVPDGFLSFPVSLCSGAIAVVLIAFCLNRVNAEYQERAVPLMGVCAAFIFAVQMVNFPIPGGTSGHLLGGTLAAVLLGPWAGSLVMSAVFIVQSVMFQDGGLITLGANIVNMGLIGTFGGYYLYWLVRRIFGQHSGTGISTAVAIAAWISVVAGSISTAIMLGISETVPMAVALTAMISWHIAIAVGEALITVVAVSFIWRTRPELIYSPFVSSSDSRESIKP